MKKNKCIFLDRDGVINKDYVDYVYTVEKFQFLEGVVEALQKFKEAGYLLIIITNQSGIVKGIYKEEDVMNVHNHIQAHTNNALDAIYFAPYHEKWTNSLTRKPNSLMLERAMAKFNIDPKQSWMIGDKPRDLYPAVKLGMRTGIINYEKIPEATIDGNNLLEIYHKVVALK